MSFDSGGLANVSQRAKEVADMVTNDHEPRIQALEGEGSVHVVDDVPPSELGNPGDLASYPTAVAPTNKLYIKIAPTVWLGVL